MDGEWYEWVASIIQRKGPHEQTLNVYHAVVHEDGICKLSARICLFLDAPVPSHHTHMIEG